MIAACQTARSRGWNYNAFVYNVHCSETLNRIVLCNHWTNPQCEKCITRSICCRISWIIDLLLLHRDHVEILSLNSEHVAIFGNRAEDGHQ